MNKYIEKLSADGFKNNAFLANFSTRDIKTKKVQKIKKVKTSSLKIKVRFETSKAANKTKPTMNREAVDNFFADKKSKYTNKYDLNSYFDRSPNFRTMIEGTVLDKVKDYVVPKDEMSI